MPHCQICNFCETTGTPSEFNSDFGFSNNKVKYYEDWGGDFCYECREACKLNQETYRVELEEKQEEEQFDFRKHLREPDETESSEKPPALSEV